MMDQANEHPNDLHVKASFSRQRSLSNHSAQVVLASGARRHVEFRQDDLAGGDDLFTIGGDFLKNADPFQLQGLDKVARGHFRLEIRMKVH
jgi:hypothetical protein